MKVAKKRALQRHGWKIGNARDFLGLSDEEATLLELKLMMAQGLKRRRTSSHLSQLALARMLRSSQSRVAKMEAGDRSVSIDLLLKALLRLGATKRDLASMIVRAA